MSEVEFGTAINSYAKPLFGFAMKLTKDDSDAKDLMQETFVKAYTNKDKFREGTNLNAWLFTIMKNSFITQYQKAARQKTYVDTSEDLHLLNTAVSHNEGARNLSLSELEARIEALDEKHRQPFVLYTKGFKYQEIAEKLNIPLGTVKNRIHVARHDLQAYVMKFRGDKVRMN